MDEKEIEKSVLKKSCADKVDNYFVGEFPTGLKILIVDDDRTCLLVLERMLRKLLYQVTKCLLARDALALLREDKKRFDIVICDLHMPDMDGLKLLEIIGLEMDLPVVMMSSDDEKGVVMKGIIHGACDYLVKPVRMEAIRLIWQHVIRRRKRSDQQPGNNIVNDRLSQLQPANTDADQLMPARDNGSCLQSLKRVREFNEDEEEGTDQSSDEATTAKKHRMIWTQELHEMFLAAINQLGRDKAVPKKILERMQAMNVTGLTRANIASHLQKYRMHVQKVGESSFSWSGKRDVNYGMFEEANSWFGQRKMQAATSCHQRHPLRTLMAPPQSCTISLIERSNENVSDDDDHHQGSNNATTVDSINNNISESTSRFLPTEDSLHDLSPPNSAAAVAFTNKDYLYSRSVSVTDQLSNPVSAVDHHFIYDQFDLHDIFRGPFL